MRRFVEEIRVKDPQIAEKIIAALETRKEGSYDPAYEVDMFISEGIEPVREREARCVEVVSLKIFIREDLNQ